MESVELLERMLNRTTLSTQRILHNHIMEYGDATLRQTTLETDDGRQDAIDFERKKLDERHKRELLYSLERQRKSLDKEHSRMLQLQLQASEELAKRVNIQRDKVEREKIRDTKRELRQEKECALAEAQEISEQRILAAIEHTKNQIYKCVDEKYKHEKNIAIQQAIENTKKECHIIAERRIQEVKDLCKHEKLTSEQILKKQFKQDLNDLNSLVNIAEKKTFEENKKCHEINDYLMEMQRDYKRFIDYTGYSSEYLIKDKFFQI